MSAQNVHPVTIVCMLDQVNRLAAVQRDITVTTIERTLIPLHRLVSSVPRITSANLELMNRRLVKKELLGTRQRDTLRTPVLNVYQVNGAFIRLIRM